MTQFIKASNKDKAIEKFDGDKSKAEATLSSEATIGGLVVKTWKVEERDTK